MFRTTAAHQTVSDIHITILLQIFLQIGFIVAADAMSADIVNLTLHHAKQKALSF